MMLQMFLPKDFRNFSNPPTQTQIGQRPMQDHSCTTNTHFLLNSYTSFPVVVFPLLVFKGGGQQRSAIPKRSQRTSSG